MKVLSEQTLVDTIRSLADKAQYRLWIAVPYIGSYETVQQILGSSWLTKHKISFKLLTDLNELNSLSAYSIMLLKKRGQVRSLAGLHAKIYVIDNSILIGSANLTKTSFTKRYEAAILLSPAESHKAIALFEKFWKTGSKVSDIELQSRDKKRSSKEDEGFNKGLVTISKLHKTNFIKEETLSKKYLSYNSIVEQFKDFTKKYQKAIGKRLWSNVPIYYEVDSFLDYLFAHAPRKPSHPYKYKKGRKLNGEEQDAALKRYTALFKEHVRTKNNQLRNYKAATGIFRNNLSERRFNKLQWGDIKRMLKHTNSGTSQPINIKKATNPNNNDLRLVRKLLYNLVNGEEQLEWRMYECDKNIFGISNAMMNEVLHFYNPNLYPLINLRSCSGLRFFGYQINEHRASKKNYKLNS
jgi:hypothetical protein